MTGPGAPADLALVGRSAEVGRILDLLDGAARPGSRARCALVGGDVGIGKTRLCREIVARARERGWRVLAGKCLTGILTPYTPFREALADAGLAHLVTFDRPARVDHILLITPPGKACATAHRTVGGLDPDIFAGMLSAVTSFVQDSLAQMQRHSSPPAGVPGSAADEPPAQVAAGIMGYGDHRILIDRRPFGTLVVAITGQETELLKDDMAELLDRVGRRHGDLLRTWNGDMTLMEPLRVEVERFLASGKYEGLDEVTGPQDRHLRFMINVTKGLGRIVKETPLLLLLDDLHWSDPSSAALLLHLLRILQHERFVILGAYRPGDVDRPGSGAASEEHPLVPVLRVLRQEEQLDEISLGRLDRESVTLLLEQEIGALARGDLGDLLARTCDGIPFLLRESAALLKERGVVVEADDGGWRLTQPVDRAVVPKRVRDTVLSRVRRLPQEHREAVEMAAVLGESFRPLPVACLLGTTLLSVHRAFREVEHQHGLVRTVGDGSRYRFDHPLVREAVYSELPRAVREEAHRTALQCIEKEDATAGSGAATSPAEPGIARLTELAYHAEAGAHPDAVRFLRRAADAARREFQNAEAVHYYRRAVDRAPAAERAGLLEATGETEFGAARFEEAEQWFRSALEATPADDVDRRALLVSRCAEAMTWRGKLRESLESFGTGPPPAGISPVTAARWRSARAWTHLRLAEHDGAERDLLAALEALRPVPPSPETSLVLADCLRNLGGVAYYHGDWATAESQYRRALEVVRSAGLRDREPRLLLNISNCAGVTGNLSVVRGLVDEAIAKAERMGIRSDVAYALLIRGTLERYQGFPADAYDTEAAAAARFAEIGSTGYHAQAVIQQALCLAALGRPEEAVATSRRGLEIAAGQVALLQLVTAWFAEVLIRCGRPAEAEAVTRPVIESLRTGRARARTAYARILLGRAVALQGRSAEADSIFRATFEEDPTALEEWESAVGAGWWGEVLCAIGQSDTGRGKLEAARRRLAAMGAAPALREVEDAIARSAST